jgi:hypothetical protein
MYPKKIRPPAMENDEEPDQPDVLQDEETMEGPESESPPANPVRSQSFFSRQKQGTPEKPKPAEKAEQDCDKIGLTTRIRADLHQRLKFHAFVNSRPISKVIEDLAETLPPVPEVYGKK